MDGACKRLSFGEGVWVRVRVIGIGLESGSESSVRVIEPSRSQGAHAQQIRHADQARRASGIERACILARVTVLQRRSGLCAAQIRQRIRFAAVQVYRHGYILFGEEHHVRHAHGGHNYHMGTRRATIYARSPSGGSGFYSHGLYRWFRRKPAPEFKWACTRVTGCMRVARLTSLRLCTFETLCERSSGMSFICAGTRGSN